MAWWLLYEELYGDMEKEYPIMSKNEDDVVILGGKSSDSITFTSDGVGAADTVSLNDTWWDDDGFSLTGNPLASPDTISFRGSSAKCNEKNSASDTISLGSYAITGSRVAGGMGNDHINFNSYPPYPSQPFSKVPEPSINKPGVHKYEEDKSLKDLKDYVSSTYSGHYTTKGSNVQTLDLIESVGDAESFCRSNAIKYLSRYDKKGQAKRDILKAMHYCLLLYYFNGNTQNEITTRGYETF